MLTLWNARAAFSRTLILLLDMRRENAKSGHVNCLIIATLNNILLFIMHITS